MRKHCATSRGRGHHVGLACERLKCHRRELIRAVDVIELEGGREFRRYAGTLIRNYASQYEAAIFSV